MKNLFPLLLTITVPMIFFTSCYMNRNFQAKAGLHYSGTYTIRSIDASGVKFKETVGTYLIDSDTLKVNDRITINVIRMKGGDQAKIITANPNYVKN